MVEKIQIKLENGFLVFPVFLLKWNDRHGPVAQQWGNVGSGGRGSSAGAHSVAVLCDWVAGHLPASANTKCLMDPGLFLGAFCFASVRHLPQRNLFPGVCFPFCLS